MPGILDSFKLDGKVALVTGCNRGLGKAIAIALAEAGADIAGVSSSPQAEETRRAVEGAGKQFLYIQADLGFLKPIPDIFEQTLNRYGRLDILVNNAGIIRRNDSLDFTENDWDDVMNVNLKYFNEG